MAIAQMPPSKTELITQVVAMPARHGRNLIGNILTASAAVVAFSGTIFTAMSALLAYKVVQKTSDCVVADLHEQALKKFNELMPAGAEAVSFRSEDGLRLEGRYFPGTRGSGVVMCHGFRACSIDLMGAAAELNERGHSVLVFDFRGHGQSEGQHSSIGYKERRDLCAAVQYLQQRPEVDPERIGVLGLSMGAATAILTAAECPAIKAVVADSSFATLRDVVYQGFKHICKLPGPVVAGPMLMFSEMFAGFKTTWVRPIDAVQAIAPRPILFIHSRNDDLIAYEHCDRLFAAAAEPKQQWLVDGPTHARTAVMFHDEYLARVGEFFADTLATPQA